MTPRLPLFLLLLVPCVPAQEIASQADPFVQAFFTQKKFQGSVLIAREGKPLFRKSYGLANAEWDIANTPDTKFRLGSITKQFTSALILQLVEEGKVKLDDSIRKYYTEAPESWQRVTIHHLLSHQSGIPSYTDLPDFFPKMSTVPRTPAEIIKLTQDKPLDFEPGSKYKYDNTGYILLGYVIEKVTGRPYAEQLQKGILDRVGMKDTGFDSYTAIIHHRADGYQYANGKLQRAPYLDMSLPYAAGSLYSTVDDLLKWDQALYGTEVLTEASKQKMWTPNRSEYGYGWIIAKRFGDETVQEHGGGINGFNTAIVRVPGKKLVAVVLANANTGSTEAIANGLLGLALGQKVEPPQEHKSISLKPEDIRRFEGKYVANADLAMVIQAEGDHLTAQANGQGGKLPIYPMSATRFFNDRISVEFDFEKDGSAMTLHQNGTEQRFKRE